MPRVCVCCNVHCPLGPEGPAQTWLKCLWTSSWLVLEPVTMAVMMSWQYSQLLLLLNEEKGVGVGVHVLCVFIVCVGGGGRRGDVVTTCTCCLYIRVCVGGWCVCVWEVTLWLHVLVVCIFIVRGVCGWGVCERWRCDYMYCVYSLTVYTLCRIHYALWLCHLVSSVLTILNAHNLNVHFKFEFGL